MTEWLKHAESTRWVIREKYESLNHEAKLSVTTQENVLRQLENIRTHPSVAAGISSGSLKLHGWVYKFETGDVYAFDPDVEQFAPIAEAKAHTPRILATPHQMNDDDVGVGRRRGRSSFTRHHRKDSRPMLARLKLFLNPFDKRWEDMNRSNWPLVVVRDTSAGLVVAMMAIPMAMGFAMASGLRPEHGILAGAIAGLVGALFAGSKYNVYGPVAALIPVIAGIMHRVCHARRSRSPDTATSS